MSTPGHVYSRLDLLDLLQGVRFEGYERAIDLHIKNLRAKIEQVPSDPTISKPFMASVIASQGIKHALDHC